jgi:hypothetical protein
MSARTVAPPTRSRHPRQDAAIDGNKGSRTDIANCKPSYPFFRRAAGNTISLGPMSPARNCGAESPIGSVLHNRFHDWFPQNPSDPEREPVKPGNGAPLCAHAGAAEAQETTAAVDISWHPLGELVCGIIERLAEANDFRKGDPDLGDVHAREFERFHRVGARGLREQPAEIGARHLIEQPVEATVQRYVQRLDAVAKASAT